jgi:Domain of unknown function DUF29
MSVKSPLYDRDFFAWSRQQAGLLRAGKLAQADIEHIAEEIDSMGRTEKRELISRLSLLLLISSNGATSLTTAARAGRRASAFSAIASPTIWATIRASSACCRRRSLRLIAMRRWRPSRRRGLLHLRFRMCVRGRPMKCWTPGSGRASAPRCKRYSARESDKKAPATQRMVTIAISDNSNDSRSYQC